MPEIAYTEYRSVAEHAAMLKQQGFRVTENLAGIPTAVTGEAGDGASLRLPLLALPQLTRAEVLGAVPGFAAPRVEALLRSLPDTRLAA